MVESLEYGVPTTEEDLQFLKAVEMQCFLGTPEMGDRYFQQIGIDNFRLVRRGTTRIGGLSILNMGQWFGGRQVTTAGIASVGIAPEHRGTGAALGMMERVIQESYERGSALSTLYPAAQRLYRRAGYEQGGEQCGWEVDPAMIRLAEHDLPIRAIAPERETLEPIYTQVAQHHNGNLDRHTSIWQQILFATADEPVYAYLVGTTPQGYIVFRQKSTSGEAHLAIADWAALTAAAGRCLWSFLASHRSQIDKIRWRGSPVDGMIFLLPEQTATLRYTERWLVRIVNAALALTSRGYPPHLEADLHLHLTDPLLPANNGPLILSVAHGQGEVKPGGRGELSLDITGLATLYTGLFTPWHLQRLGQVEGTAGAIATATALFAGPTPWMPDFF
ncbi:MAG: GNAT family N-acetyltransferase [Synechococcales bacterium]|nr:GNAT family N-acetyltransferase [Synechococcales bacterium]